MDDKLLNILVSLIFVGIWVFQYFHAKKQEAEEERRQREADAQNDDGDDMLETLESDYADDPYLKVQEEIRRKVAERQAAEREASRQGRTTATAQQQERSPAQPQARQAPAQPQPASTPYPYPATQGQSRPQQGYARQETRQYPPAQPQAPQYDQALIDRLAAAAATTAQSSHTPFPKARVAASIHQGAYQNAPRVARVPAIRERLRSPAAAREAIVLREVLGPRGGIGERGWRD